MSIVAPLLKAFMGGNWSQDQGVDINGGTSTIAGQPLLAIGAGTIVGHGISGFGSWAPILKLDQPINGYQYVYYGHAGPKEVPVGTHVPAGGLVGEVGAGIVGMSTGPHLEIGFSDVRGTPVPGSAATMMQLLRGATTANAPGTRGAQLLGPTGTPSSDGGISIPNLNPFDAINSALNGLFNSIVSHARYDALALIAIMGAFVLIGRGVSRTTHAEGVPA